jgi:hypothetical protein
MSTLFELHEPHVTLVEYFLLTLAFPHTSGWTPKCANSDYYYYFPEDY